MAETKPTRLDLHLAAIGAITALAQAGITGDAASNNRVLELQKAANDALRAAVHA